MAVAAETAMEAAVAGEEEEEVAVVEEASFSLSMMICIITIYYASFRLFNTRNMYFGGTISLDMGRIAGLHCMRESFHKLWQIYIYVALVVSQSISVSKLAFTLSAAFSLSNAQP